jgi:membrane-associated phospholipid phosphatase
MNREDRTTPLLRIGNRFGDFDSRASAWLYRRNFRLVARAAILLSAPGSPRLFIPCSGLAIAAALLERQYAGGAALALVTIVTYAFISACKRNVLRTRPAVSGLTTGSFPSGHTMASIAVYGTAAFVLTGSDTSRLPVIAGLSCFLGLTVGGARVVRGYHWLSDVAAGLASGLTLLLLFCNGLSRL